MPRWSMAARRVTPTIVRRDAATPTAGERVISERDLGGSSATMLRQVVMRGTASFGRRAGLCGRRQDRHRRQAQARGRLLRGQGGRHLRRGLSRPTIRNTCWSSPSTSRVDTSGDRAAPHRRLDRGAGRRRDDPPRRAAAGPAAQTGVTEARRRLTLGVMTAGAELQGAACGGDAAHGGRARSRWPNWA